MRACRSSSCSSSDIGRRRARHGTSLAPRRGRRHAAPGRARRRGHRRGRARTDEASAVRVDRAPRRRAHLLLAGVRRVDRRSCDRTPPRRSPRRPCALAASMSAFVARGARTAKRVSGPITAARRPPHTLRRCATRLADLVVAAADHDHLGLVDRVRHRDPRVVLDVRLADQVQQTLNAQLGGIARVGGPALHSIEDRVTARARVSLLGGRCRYLGVISRRAARTSARAGSS